MKVKFLPEGQEIEIAPDQSVMDLAHKNGIFIKSICGGVPNCAECRVKVVEGEENLMEPSNNELNLIGTGHFIDRRRLSCQMKCFGDITIDLSEQLEKQKTAPKKVLGNRQIDLDKSHATNQMLVDTDKDLVDKVEKNLEQRQARPRPKGGSGAGGGNKKRNNRNRNRNRNRSGGKSSGGGGSSQGGSSSGGNRSGNTPKKSD